MNTQTKSIEYAYPTSPFAHRNGFGATGCWYVAIYNDYKVKEYRTVTTNKADAVIIFDAIALPVNRFHSHLKN